MNLLRRIPTLVPGLDDVLRGGLFEGGVYIVEGPPGVGKTTLANQMAYNFAQAHGQKTVYVTLLAESHARMLQHMGAQTFFRIGAVNREVIYMSAYRELERDGLKGVIALLREEVTRHGAGLLVVDGLVIPSDGNPIDEQVRQFVHELQSVTGLLNCLCLLLTSGTGRSVNAEQTMVDGIFRLEDLSHRWRAERRFHVRKFRGSAVERGGHTFCITDDGLRFYPRFETTPLQPREREAEPRVVSSGLAALDDQVLAGGLRQGSSTAVYGPSGSGKTLLAMAFAAASSVEEPGLVLSFGESPEDLKAVAGACGMDLAQRVADGSLTFTWRDAQEQALDEIGHHLLRMVDEGGVRRLVVDGVAGLADTPAFAERGYRFMGHLLLQLQARGVTALFTIDPQAFDAAGGGPPAQGLMGWFDNVVELQLPAVGEDGRLAVLRKLRGGRARRTLLHLRMSDAGLSAQ
ncbi:ATPase domain-containing protein [Aquabacterium sp. J223]|uniref:RAD55 family ATPase n=1 Tax=Aquabacterium sp. J223 TaxID=2898431 RepID=UPI0021AD9AC1|nr:ATPase domain-containing protein [Aquabacterium sp. J223]UUX94445.1 AAA family ATPase [Aquabacterium sp. J223]